MRPRLFLSILLAVSPPLAIAEDAEAAARLKRVAEEIAKRRNLAQAEGKKIDPADLARMREEIAKRRRMRQDAAGDRDITIDPPARPETPGSEKWVVVMRNERLEYCGKALAGITRKKVTLNGRVAAKTVTLDLRAEKRDEAVAHFRPALEKQGIALLEIGTDGLLLTEAPAVPR